MSRCSARLAATLGLAGAIALGTTSTVAAAINRETVSETASETVSETGSEIRNARDIPSFERPVELAQVSSLVPFTCAPNFYLSQADDLSSPSQLNDVTIDLNANPVVNLATIPAGINPNATPYNAIGYNQKDDYLYGVENDFTGTNADHNIVRIGADGNTEIVRTLPDPGNRRNGDILNYVVGDVIVEGGTAYLYTALANLNTFYRVNLDDPSAPAEVMNRTGDTTSFVDFAFHPTNGKLYGISSDQHNQADRLIEITISGTTATVDTLTLSAPLPGNKFGGVFFDGNGTFYAYHNGDSGANVNVPQANLYAIEIDEATNTYTWTHLGEAANVNQNDGARCAAAQPPAVLTGLVPTGNPSLGGKVWDDTNFNGIQDAGEPRYDNVVVELLTTDGTVQDTQTTSDGGVYNFTNLAPDDYRVQVTLPNDYLFTRRNRGNNDETDSDVNPTTGRTARITLAQGNNIDHLDAGISLDTDDDTIPDVVDGTGDRDGDGTPNYQDIDPAGYFYDETTGEIIAGGLVSVSGPGGINLTDDGSTGFYQWFIDGTAGTYTMTVTPPPGYALSSTCLEQSTFDPTGGADPTVLGNYENIGNPGFLTGNECNTFYLSFELADGDPFVINNNLPLAPIASRDYGDAPDSYGTDSTNNSGEGIGASHILVNGIQLGATADAETDAATPLDGTSDGADDDGVTLPASIAQGETISLTITTTGSGVLNAWIDWNADGDFNGSNEQIATDADVSGGTLSVTAPVGATVGNTYARFRYSSQTGLVPTGGASDGEVEDYVVAIAISNSPNVVLVKRITAINGDRIKNPNDNTSLNVVVSDGIANSPDDEAHWPENYLQGEINAGLVLPGDEIEYTVYFLNAEDNGAEDVRICDWVQANQSIVAAGYNGHDVELQLGDGAGSTTYGLSLANDAGDRAQLTTVDTLPAGPTCNLPAASAGTTDDVLMLDLTGTTGDPAAITTTLPGSTLPGTPNEAFGFIRFTTQVND